MGMCLGNRQPLRVSDGGFSNAQTFSSQFSRWTVGWFRKISPHWRSSPETLPLSPPSTTDLVFIASHSGPRTALKARGALFSPSRLDLHRHIKKVVLHTRLDSYVPVHTKRIYTDAEGMLIPHSLLAAPEPAQKVRIVYSSPNHLLCRSSRLASKQPPQAGEIAAKSGAQAAS